MTRAGKIDALAAALAAIPRVWLAFADQGHFWPDEIFQSLEQAHRFAFGYGLQPWEFVIGARSWLLPGAIGLLWKLEAALGVTSSPVLVISIKLVLAALSIVTIVATMRLARRFMDDPAGETADHAAILAAVFGAALPPLVLFATKAYGETVSVPFMMLAVVLGLDPGPRRQIAAGACGALAIFLRYQNGVVVAGVFVLLLARRRWKDALWYAGAALVVALLVGGLLDWLTWGKPLNSFIEYARFHTTGGANPWGTKPFAFYAEVTWTAVGPALVAGLAGLAFAPRRAWPHLAIAVAYFVVTSAVPHKEYRYIVAVFPLAIAIAAAGLARGIARFPRQRVSTAVLASAVLGALTVHAQNLTFHQLGHHEGIGPGLVPPTARVWHGAEGINRMLWEAGARSDVCGVLLANINWTSSGAYTYLHRDVPLMWFWVDPNTRRAANYLIAKDDYARPWEFEPVGESRGFKLYRREGACAPPPPGYTRRPPP